jgi:hypothetical protein
MANIKFGRKKSFLGNQFFLFLFCHPFSFCNFNFYLKIYFLNISHLKFEKEKRKVPQNNEEERKLVNSHFQQ